MTSDERQAMVDKARVAWGVSRDHAEEMLLAVGAIPPATQTNIPTVEELLEQPAEYLLGGGLKLAKYCMGGWCLYWPNARSGFSREIHVWAGKPVRAFSTVREALAYLNTNSGFDSLVAAEQAASQ